MSQSHKGGSRGRKTIRSVKRERYKKSFEHRYGMPRNEWVQWKREHTGATVHAKREEALR